MKKIKLGDVLDIRRGTSLSGKFYSNEGNLIRLTLGNFNYPRGGFQENFAKENIFFNGTVNDAFILSAGDIITPLTEQVSGLLGETATIPESGKYIQSGDIGLVVPDETKIDKRFAYYLVSSPIVRKQLDAAAQQTKIRHTSPAAIKSYTTWIPEDISTQRKIAEFLDSLADKIALNKKINATLEAMAKTLYDYWFVQFDFPDENGKSYKSSGGKMIYNAELGREIPASWKVGTLSDFVTISTEIKTPLYSPSKIYEHYSIPAYDNGKFPSMDKGSDIESGKYVVSPKNILYSKLNPKIKRIWRPFCFTKNAICSTEFLVFKILHEENSAFFYATLNADSFQQYMEKQASASTGSRKRVQPDNCLRYSIISPDDTTMGKFCEIYSSLLEKIDATIIESRRLAALRDWLLPMLMNGQVNFKET